MQEVGGTGGRGRAAGRSAGGGAGRHMAEEEGPRKGGSTRKK